MGWEKVSTTKERLREAMEIAGIKQIEIATATGISRGTISKYLSGKFEPKSEHIAKLARVLNCSEMWLWGYKAPRERSEKQRKNDRISNVINRIRSDTEFAEMIISLDDLDDDKLASIKQLITVFNNK